MGSDGVVLPPPLFDEHFRLLQRVEDLPLQDFFAQRPVEAFVVAILPRLPGSIYSVFTSTRSSHSRTTLAVNSGPLSDRRLAGGPWLDKELTERLQHIVRPEPSGHYDRQTLPAVFIQHRQHLQRPTVVRPIRHEVIRPDVMAVQGSKPDA